MMSIIGKRFKDAGLRDLAVESEVIAEGSVDGVLDGRKYNRAVRFHKLLYEALYRLVWKQFYEWIEETNMQSDINLTAMLDEIQKLHNNTTQDQMDEFLLHPTCIHFMNIFNTFIEVLRNDHGPMAGFWMSYLDMVEIVLGLIRASREGN